MLRGRFDYPVKENSMMPLSVLSSHMINEMKKPILFGADEARGLSEAALRY
jgi:hypothetical protein